MKDVAQDVAEGVAEDVPQDVAQDLAFVESLGVRPGYVARFDSLAMSAGWV